MILTWIISDILKIEDKAMVNEISSLIEILHNCSLIIGNFENNPRQFMNIFSKYNYFEFLIYLQ